MGPRHAFLASFLLLVVAACVRPITGCTCSPAPPSAVLAGTVVAPDGSPVQGAVIRAEHAAPGCAAPVTSMVEPGSAPTAADGSFRVTLYHYGYPRPGDCLRAVAEPPAGSALAASDPVLFAVRFGPGLPLDSARVDLVLRQP